MLSHRKCLDEIVCGHDPFFMEDDRFMELVNNICKRLGVEEVRETAEPPWWKKRCQNCEYQFEDYDGEWRCAEYWEMLCENIKKGTCVVEE